MKIVKLTDGRIQLRDDSGNVYQSFSGCDVNAELKCNNEVIQIVSEGQYINIIVDDVSAYQIEPAPEVAGPFTAEGLLSVLDTDFFLCAGISGAIDVNIVSPDPLPVDVMNTVTIQDGGGSITVDGTVAVTDGGGSITVDGTVNANITGGTVTAEIEQNLDAFYRLRVSYPKTIFDSKQTSDNLPLFWDDAQVSGAGTSSLHSSNRASTVLIVSNLTAGVRVRQTFRRFNYQPGKSQLAMFTFVFGAAATGITRRAGLFDANNGIFLQQTSSGPALVIRSLVTGAPVDTVIPQASWNIDKLDGTGTSGVTLDLTKGQIFFFDFEWLGVGTIRFGFFIDGVPIYCHARHNSNVIASVSISTPNLPLRYEIQNDGTGPGAGLEQICSTIMSEGGQEQTGLIMGLNRGANSLLTLNTAQLFPLISMRLRTGYFGSSVKPVDFSVICTSTAAYNWYLLLNPVVAGTPLAWTAVTNSSIEADLVSTSATTVTGGTILRTGTAVQSNAANSGGSIRIDDDFYLGSSIAGTADVLMLAIQRVTGTTETFFAGLNYIDQK